MANRETEFDTIWLNWGFLDDGENRTEAYLARLKALFKFAKRNAAFSDSRRPTIRERSVGMS